MLDALKALFDFILHIDHHLARIIAAYGAWTYGILFAIIFVETGLVVMPFLPGDSLLFAAGAFCARPETGLNIHLLTLLLWIAGVLGDSLNYAIGARLGPAVFSRPDSRLLRRAHLERAQTFPLLRRARHPARPLRPGRAHLRAVRRRRGPDALSPLPRL